MSEPKVYDVAPLVVTAEAPGIDTEPPLIQAIAREMKKDLGKKRWARAAEFAAQNERVKIEEFSKKSASFGSDVEGDRDSQDYGKVILAQVENEFVGKIKKSEEFAREFFEKGYAGLTNDQDRIDLRQHVIDQALRVPLVAERVRDMNAAERKAFAERLILDPTFTGELKKAYNEILEKDFNNDVVESFEDHQEALNGLNIVNEELRIVEAQTANVQSRLNSFRRNENGSAATGAGNAERMDKLRNDPENNPSIRRQQITSKEQELIGADALVTRLESNLSTTLQFSMQSQKTDPELYSAQSRLAAIRNNISAQDDIINNPDISNKTQAINKKALLAGDLTTQQELVGRLKSEQMGAPGMESFTQINTELEKARESAVKLKQELATLKGLEDELKALEAEESEVQDRLKTLETEKRGVLERQQVEQMKTDRAGRKYEEAKKSRLSEEEIFTERLVKAGGEAAASILGHELNEVTESFDGMFRKVKEGSQSMHETALYVTLQNTWLGPETIRKTEGFVGKRKKETVRPLDKAKILHDYNTLLSEGDVSLVRSLIKRTENPDTKEFFTDDEIDDVFDKNPNLVAKFKPEAIKQLLARKAMVGGFTPEDSYILASAPWGPGAVEAAYNQNAGFRRLIDTNFQEGALKRHGFMQRFGQELAKHPGWWSLLLGIPALVKAFGTEASRDTLDAQR